MRSRLRNFRAGLIAAAALTGFLSASPSANALTWTLGGATFDDGGTLVSGSYFSVGTPSEPYADYTNFSVTTTKGTTLSGDTYYSPTGFSDELFTYPIGSSSPTYNAIEFFDNVVGTERVLVLVFQNSLLYPGIDLLVGGLSGSFECFGYSCDPQINDGYPAGPLTGLTRYISADNNTFFAAAAPLPATWSMLIAGFVGLIGFVALGGKKRKVAATAAV
jgi:hypothetical protein